VNCNFIMEGMKGIPLSSKKYLFPGILLLVVVMIVILYQRLGGGGVMVIDEALRGFVADSSESHSLNDGNDGDSPHGHRHHQHLSGFARSHVHEDEVHFVLHESALGAPEFIGRNDRKATFIDFDPSGTFLNAPGHAVAAVFNADSYKEKNIAIGLAITTREQEINTTTLALELPFFNVCVFHNVLISMSSILQWHFSSAFECYTIYF